MSINYNNTIIRYDTRTYTLIHCVYFSYTFLTQTWLLCLRNFHVFDAWPNVVVISLSLSLFALNCWLKFHTHVCKHPCICDDEWTYAHIQACIEQTYPFHIPAPMVRSSKKKVKVRKRPIYTLRVCHRYLQLAVRVGLNTFECDLYVERPICGMWNELSKQELFLCISQKTLKEFLNDEYVVLLVNSTKK